MPKRMAVVVDYQNVHLTGTELFLPGRPVEEGLVDPFRFACQLAKARNDGSPPEHAVEVARVEVFRGLPSDQDDARAYARNLAQRSEWMKGHHGVVEVTRGMSRLRLTRVDALPLSSGSGRPRCAVSTSWIPSTNVITPVCEPPPEGGRRRSSFPEESVAPAGCGTPI